MPKMRSRKSIQKRITVLKGNKIRVERANNSHLFFNKTNKQRKRLKKEKFLNINQYYNIKKCL